MSGFAVSVTELASGTAAVVSDRGGAHAGKLDRGIGRRVRLAVAAIAGGCIFGSGSRLCVNSTGSTSRGVTTTRAPILVMPKSCGAKEAGKADATVRGRITRNDAGVQATPDQVMRCIHGIGAPE